MTSDIFEFKVENKDVQVVMLGGILNKVISKIGSVEGIESMVTNPEIQSEVLEIVLSEYDDTGKVLGKKCSSFNLPVEVQADIISWVGCHVVNFFAKASKAMTQKALDLQEELQKTRSSRIQNG